MTVDNQTLEMLKWIQELWAHKNAHYTQAGLVKEMAQFILNKIDPLKKQKATVVSLEASTKTVVSKGTAAANTKSHVKSKTSNFVQTSAAATAKTETQCQGSSLSPSPSAKNPRMIPATLRRQIWQRDKGQCQYKSHTGKLCGTRFGLEIDHIHPVALGGTSTTENLRLLCKTHNALEAVRLRL